MTRADRPPEEGSTVQQFLLHALLGVALAWLILATVDGVRDWLGLRELKRRLRSIGHGYVTCEAPAMAIPMELVLVAPAGDSSASNLLSKRPIGLPLSGGVRCDGAERVHVQDLGGGFKVTERDESERDFAW